MNHVQSRAGPGGLVFTLFVGWKMSKASVRDELTNGGKCNAVSYKFFYYLIRFVAPVGIVAVSLTNLLL